MGTTSFTHDQFNWLMKSEEVNPDAHHPHESDDHISLVESSGSLSDESEPKNTEKSTEKSADISTTEIVSTETEVAAVSVEEEPVSVTEPVIEDRKLDSEVERERNLNPKSPPTEEKTRHFARGSDASGQSFAFPLLVGEVDGGSPMKTGPGSQEKLQEETKTQPPEKISTSADQEVHAETAEAAQSSSSWFSRCIAFCSCK